jgi:hypothetical protein
MNFKLKGLMLGTALSALAFTACQSAPVETTNKTNTTKANEAVVVNSNTNATTNSTYTVSNMNSANGNMTSMNGNSANGNMNSNRSNTNSTNSNTNR